SNPTALHAEAIDSAIAFDCPIFIEKPVLSHPSQVQDLLPAIQRKRIITYTACNLRFHPVVTYMRDLVKQTELKVFEVNIYCGSLLSEWRVGTDYRKSYSANREMGGGVDLDLIHELDYCCWIFGTPAKWFSTRRKVSGLEINSPDSVSYILEYEYFTANIVLNYFRRDSKRTVEFVTNNGTFTGDLLANSIMHNNEPLFTAPSFTMADTYTMQMRYFLQSLRNGQKPMNSFEEAVDILKIAIQ
ncbi:MAG: Gfo/Idh/MocA family oxidoreductase, partial [Bacteroidota bacterium]|nr:Gfo/Idh/MocA family oxidoreductase [Bacteroidota bacterium]